MSPKARKQRSSKPDAPTAPVSDDAIQIHGAREHNLKNLSLRIPRDRFVVITGVSGSGKSTLAFDLLFAEGQRRFLDSMSAYARQFVEQMSRPDVDLITGVPPTVSIEQRTSRGGGKSTVATVTEIYHFIRLLFARLGAQHCPDCGCAVEPQTRDEMLRRLARESAQRGDLTLLAPLVKHRKGFHTDLAEWAASHGYEAIRADGKIYKTSEPMRLDRFREHDVEVVVGTLRAKARRSSPGKADSIAGPRALAEAALKIGKGTLLALDSAGRATVHSTERACPECGQSFTVLDPKMFSYNSAQGWCPECRGFGELFELPDVERGARADAIEESWFGWTEGNHEACEACHGSRLNRIARAVRLPVSDWGSPSSVQAGAVRGPTVEAFSDMPVAVAGDFFARLRFEGAAEQISRDILPEIRERLSFLQSVGLGYLHLGRAVTTLSGGESQRIRLAAQLGSNLSGVLYILDEPTIGLHSRDNERLLEALEQLRERGNSVVVVEHDEETMRRADWIIDLGPGAGVRGGEVIAEGTLSQLAKHPRSVTGECLRARRHHPARGERRPVSAPKRGAGEPGAEWLTIGPVTLHNLKALKLRIPLGRFVAVTGVSGSGKSTLVREGLLPSLAARLRKSASPPFPIEGWESLKAVYEVDQAPIGRTPRSTPATYVGFFNEIRDLFAATPEARMRGYTASRFSFNSAAGRCPGCEGAGMVKLEMNFLPPAYVKCEACFGTRFNRETLDVLFRGKSIADVLELSVEEAIEFFASQSRILHPLQVLNDTGLGYVRLGQTSPTLSGGEAQRVKLVTHLLTGLKDALSPSRRPKTAAKNLFILEEPTVGLHMSDVRRLVDVIQRLVDGGHSVLVIEHNIDLICDADWVIDLGPEGGEGGGALVAEGTPEAIARTAASHTARYLQAALSGSPSRS
ncbi:MAG: excinuclease ABC subunit A [Verrucomicrobia bacterium]|nr:excinuclease ABC subunit A [Verrucomicrobiota bacterium]